MEPVETTRRIRLGILIKRHKGLANLCEALGLARTQTSGLSRIANANLRNERDGEPYVMGSPQARDIERKLGLTEGWMDTPPTYDELDPDPQVAKLIEIARMLKAEDRSGELAQLVAIGHTFVEPPARQANGD